MHAHMHTLHTHTKTYIHTNNYIHWQINWHLNILLHTFPRECKYLWLSKPDNHFVNICCYSCLERKENWQHSPRHTSTSIRQVFQNNNNKKSKIKGLLNGLDKGIKGYWPTRASPIKRIIHNWHLLWMFQQTWVAYTTSPCLRVSWNWN